MKILFIVHEQGTLRNFVSFVRMLSEKGHEVSIVCKPKKAKHQKLHEGLKDCESQLQLIGGPISRSDKWQAFTEPLRAALNYIHYLDSRYENAFKLKRRVDRAVSPRFKTFCERIKVQNRFQNRFISILKFAESLIPSDLGIESFLKEQNPDVILITPLIRLDTLYQTEYLKSANALGIPVAFLPFSWDNLTNKGLIPIHPDRVIVWNETQKAEAIEIHSISPDKISITGAWRFDDFFSREPSVSKEELCNQFGLDPSRHILTYICSSEFVAPPSQEIDFVKRWVDAIRKSNSQDLRSSNILIRPYPDRKEKWNDVAFENPSKIVVTNSAWEELYGGLGSQGIYDCMYHSSAVIGLNTSAMIEAGILGKPVHTIVVPEFAGGQQQTIHFHYLTSVAGGLLTLAHSLDEHLHQLANSLSDNANLSEKSLQFTEAFIRPFGLNVAATPLAVKEVEDLAQVNKANHQYPYFKIPLQFLLYAFLKSPLGLLEPFDEEKAKLYYKSLNNED
jgi:hypothetical protein